METKCKINHCRKTTKYGAKGYCNSHYNAQRNYGDVLYFEKNVTKKCHDCEEQIPRLKKRCFKCQRIAIKERESKRVRGSFKNCAECKKQFFSMAKKYCGRNCFFKSQKKNRRGKNNPAYRNGDYVGVSSGLPNNGNRNTGAVQCKEYKEKFIDINDHVFCERCKAFDSPRFEVHHLVFRSEAPRHKNLHNEDNLVLLCIECHNKMHKDKESREELYKFQKTKLLFPDIFNK